MKRTSILFIATLFLLSSCTEEKEVSKEPKIVKVGIETVKSNTKNETLNYSGTIEADNTVMLGFMASGRVTEVKVEEGQKVEKGQLLATLDATSYQNAYDIANAGLELANDNYKRLKGLYDKGSLPERDFIQIKVGVTQAKANKNLAAKNLADATLYAPFSGMITSKSIEIGAITAPGAPAFTIMKTDEVYAVASISEDEISKLKIGASALVHVPSLNKSVEGKIAIVNYSADAITRTFKVKVKLDNPSGELLPGLISTLKINTENAQDLVAIPAKVIVRDVNDITYAYVVKNNKAIKKRVTLGGFSGDNVIVLDGINSGDQLVVKGYTNLKDGQTISL